jgi:acetolactate decarboxylase
MNTTLHARLLLALTLIAGCREAPTTKPSATTPTAVARPGSGRAAAGAEGDQLVQFSLLAALAAGDYGGGAPLARMLEFGDFGVGTFDGLDGEMIVLDGAVYQVLADGEVVQRTDEGATPFATVTFFDADGTLTEVAAASLQDLDQSLDRRLPHAKRPYALRVSAEFAELTLRSAPPQSPPYRPLAEVIDQQRVWTRENVRGTLIGIRCPAWMGTLNVAGYHWHFLSDDRTIGGHVLDCRFAGGRLTYDECSSVLIELPGSASFGAVDMSGVSDADVDKIERQRSGR